jgi:hypothetical protein
MSARAATMDLRIETSPQVYARIAGALYLVVIVFGAFAEGYITNTLIVPGDSAASARHILNSPGLWQLGIACNLIVALCAVPQTWIEYLLLRPAAKNLILLGVLMQLAGVSYLIACFAALFAPALADAITPAILVPALIGEASFCLWLLIKGVNVAKWRERAAAPA